MDGVHCSTYGEDAALDVEFNAVNKPFCTTLLTGMGCVPAGVYETIIYTGRGGIVGCSLL